MSLSMHARYAPRRPIALHPFFIAALILLLLNDHVLKASVGNWWTGKLSDAAWLVLCPLFIVGVYESVCGRAAGLRVFVISSVLVGAALVAINVVPLAGDLYQTGLAAAQWPFKALAATFGGDPLPAIGRVQLTRDPTDLLTLPFALIPVAIGDRTAPV